MHQQVIPLLLKNISTDLELIREAVIFVKNKLIAGQFRAEELLRFPRYPPDCKLRCGMYMNRNSHASFSDSSVFF